MEKETKKDLPCPGSKIKSKGLGQGLGHGAGKGPIGRMAEKSFMTEQETKSLERLEKATRKKPYGHKGYVKHTKHGYVQVKQKGVKPTPKKEFSINERSVLGWIGDRLSATKEGKSLIKKYGKFDFDRLSDLFDSDYLSDAEAEEVYLEFFEDPKAPNDRRVKSEAKGRYLWALRNGISSAKEIAREGSSGLFDDDKVTLQRELKCLNDIARVLQSFAAPYASEVADYVIRAWHKDNESPDNTKEAEKKQKTKKSYWVDTSYDNMSTVEDFMKAFYKPTKPGVKPGKQYMDLGARANRFTPFKPKPKSAPATKPKFMPKFKRSIECPFCSEGIEAEYLIRSMTGDVTEEGETMSKGIECPHCHEELSVEYAVKSLSVLAKSEGYDFDEELSALADGAEAGLDEEYEHDDNEAEKGVKRGKKAGVKGSTGFAGNKTDSHRGKAPGSFNSSSRAASGEAVERHHRPTNMANEGGMAKSIRAPVIIGEPRLVDYGYGQDAQVADSITKGINHVPPMRNLKAEQELAQGETEE